MQTPKTKNWLTRIQLFVGELKRRKVFQVTSFYLVAAWGLSAGAADIFAVLGFPTWASRYFVIGVFTLTPVVVVIAWVFELNKSGIKLDQGPTHHIDQTTVLADRPALASVTAKWRNKTYKFSKTFTIGRDDSCELQIIDPMISRQHARVECVDDGWIIKDLGSANGLIINGQKTNQQNLKEHVDVRLFPDGPFLSLTINRAVSAETQLVGAKPHPIEK